MLDGLLIREEGSEEYTTSSSSITNNDKTSKLPSRPSTGPTVDIPPLSFLEKSGYFASNMLAEAPIVFLVGIALPIVVKLAINTFEGKQLYTNEYNAAGQYAVTDLNITDATDIKSEQLQVAQAYYESLQLGYPQTTSYWIAVLSLGIAAATVIAKALLLIRLHRVGDIDLSQPLREEAQWLKSAHEYKFVGDYKIRTSDATWVSAWLSQERPELRAFLGILGTTVLIALWAQTTISNANVSSNFSQYQNDALATLLNQNISGFHCYPDPAIANQTLTSSQRYDACVSEANEQAISLTIQYLVNAFTVASFVIPLIVAIIAPMLLKYFYQKALIDFWKVIKDLPLWVLAAWTVNKYYQGPYALALLAPVYNSVYNEFYNFALLSKNVGLGYSQTVAENYADNKAAVNVAASILGNSAQQGWSIAFGVLMAADIIIRGYSIRDERVYAFYSRNLYNTMFIVLVLVALDTMAFDAYSAQYVQQEFWSAYNDKYNQQKDAGICTGDNDLNCVKNAAQIGISHSFAAFINKVDTSFGTILFWSPAVVVAGTAFLVALLGVITYRNSLAANIQCNNLPSVSSICYFFKSNPNSSQNRQSSIGDIEAHDMNNLEESIISNGSVSSLVTDANGDGIDLSADNDLNSELDKNDLVEKQYCVIS